MKAKYASTIEIGGITNKLIFLDERLKMSIA